MFPDTTAPYFGTFVRDSCIFFDQPVKVAYPGNKKRANKLWFYMAIYLRALGAIPSAKVVVVHYPLFFMPLVMFARLLRKKVVLAYHGGEFMERPNTGKMLDWLRRRIFRINNHFAVGIFVPSNYVADQYFPKVANKTVVWYSGGIAVKPSDRWPQTRRWTFVFFGREEAVKGFDCMLRAIEVLSEDPIDPDGELNCLLVNRDRLDLNERTIGRISLTESPAQNPQQVEKNLLNAEFTVIPSRNESLCLLALEAANCGSIVIARDLAAIRETLGESALYFVRDEELPDVMQAAIQMSADQRDRLRRGAKERVRQYDRVNILKRVSNGS